MQITPRGLPLWEAEPSRTARSTLGSALHSGSPQNVLCIAVGLETHQSLLVGVLRKPAASGVRAYAPGAHSLVPETRSEEGAGAGLCDAAAAPARSSRGSSRAPCCGARRPLRASLRSARSRCRATAHNPQLRRAALGCALVHASRGYLLSQVQVYLQIASVEVHST